ncbi:MAG: tyrosine-type recombinase/integrase [Clostridia bacterium]|nr:tyrosine-type recombinase/integrase [Clostridia bacterium]
MKNEVIKEIEQKMAKILNNEQKEKLKEVLLYTFYDIEVTKKKDTLNEDTTDYAQLFISAKRIEGCSERTLNYYKSTIDNMIIDTNKKINCIETEDLRKYLAEYQSKNNCSKVTIDNVRRILSSFFAWLEDEDYIIKSPVRRIHKVKATQTVKETYTDEELEEMRDACSEIRDLAMIDFLSSTGVRVGELVKLDIADVNFQERACVVLGKGAKEREVYFDARTKIHLQNYLNTRTDNNPALFVSLLKPFNRLKISGVEIRLRELGKKTNIKRVHPHKFRRSMATRAIDKGMPIEQVQVLLGHRKVDTTLQYAMVNQNNVKNSHKKYIC